jgi:hypothetical protein
MSELAWLIILEVTNQEGVAKGKPWSRYLHYMLMTQPIRTESAVVITGA